jgi:hypothetical protein
MKSMRMINSSPLGSLHLNRDGLNRGFRGKRAKPVGERVQQHQTASATKIEAIPAEKISLARIAVRVARALRCAQGTGRYMHEWSLRRRQHQLDLLSKRSKRSPT